MDVKHLNYIITIAKEKNISKAAAKLFISQSSLSSYLTSLEKEVGTSLFVRQRNGVEITEAGKKYVEAAQKVIKIHDELYNEIAVNKEHSTVSIAAASLWGTRLFSDAIPKFRKDHPEATFKLTQTELYYLSTEIDKGDIDFAFITLEPDANISPSMKILREEEVFLSIPLSHHYVKENPTDIMDSQDLKKFFADDTFILSRVGSANRTVATNLFSSLSFTPASIIETNGIPLTANLVAEGTGVSLIPLSGIDIRANEIKHYHITPRQFRYNILLSKPKSLFSEVEKEFYKFVLHFFPDIH